MQTPHRARTTGPKRRTTMKYRTICTDPAHRREERARARRDAREALKKVLLHRMVTWTRDSNREYLLTEIALCGRCHTRLYGAPDQTDLAAAAAQPHSDFPRLGSDVRSAAGGAGSRVSRDCSARQWLPVGAPGLGIPSHPVPRRARRGLGPGRARFLSGREGQAHLRVPLGGASAPQAARQGRQVACRRPIWRIDAARQNLPPLTQ